jgi:hypothetical protein
VKNIFGQEEGTADHPAACGGSDADFFNQIPQSALICEICGFNFFARKAGTAPKISLG